MLFTRIRFGKPITVDQYEAQFLSDEEGAARTCAKSLTKQITSEMLSLTINAPDWYVAPINEPFIAESIILQGYSVFCQDGSLIAMASC